MQFRYLPAAAATLGIHELDDQVVGKFSFHCQEAVMRILTTAGGLENLQISLMAEVIISVIFIVLYFR